MKMAHYFVIACLLASSSGLQMNMESHTESKPMDSPPCASNMTFDTAGFRCKACVAHQIPNFATYVETNSAVCILSGKAEAGTPTLTLVQTRALPPEICHAGEGARYSWDAKFHLTECEEKYAAVLWKQYSGSALRKFTRTIGREQDLLKLPMPEQFAGIHASDHDTPLGKRTVAEVWPRRGTCTQKNRCMLYVHLHALFEVVRPSMLFCGMLPKYVTNDPSCYNKLRSVLLIPQAQPNFLVENWNPDGDVLNNHAGIKSFDTFLFPLVESFLTNHSDQIDPERVHIGGGSSGANGAVYAAVKRPDIFSVAVASDVCAGGFLTDPEDKELIRNMPPPTKRRLKSILIGRGDNADIESICDDTTFSMDTVADLAKKVPVHVRIFNGLGHGIWGHFMNQWPALHELLITGTRRDI